MLADADSLVSEIEAVYTCIRNAEGDGVSLSDALAFPVEP